MKNILELLERSAMKFPQKTAFTCENDALNYENLVTEAKSIGIAVAEKYSVRNKPVAVFLPRGVECLVGMFGVVYSGNFYTVVDYEMPEERIRSVFDTLNPIAVITDKNGAEKIASLKTDTLLFDELKNTPIHSELLKNIRDKSIDTDPVYALFTSGSTGVPKGAVLCHKNVLSYSKWFVDTFEISEATVFGSQTPFYFSMSVSDVFGTLRAGATLHIIPKKYFSFPVPLINYLNERRVNTIYWVPSALCILANWKALDYVKPQYIQKVLFAGEVMPTKQLNYWIEQLPNAQFANLFGPTETTDICTYYVVDRKFNDTETLPIGKACNNCDVFVINNDGKLAETGEEGELYARGSFLAMGYYSNPKKTEEAFVQNPINPFYPEIVYKTGDLVKYNENGELIYITRKDFQIKHMGYRIELGEVEAAANAMPRVTACSAIYDAESDKIVLIVTGKKLNNDEMITYLKKLLPDYMMPGEIIKIAAMPYNSNGKIDRKWLSANYKTFKK